MKRYLKSTLEKANSSSHTTNIIHAAGKRWIVGVAQKVQGAITIKSASPAPHLVYFDAYVAVPFAYVEPERGVLQVQLGDAGREVEVEQLVTQLVLG